MGRMSRTLRAADMAWLPDVFIVHDIILPPIVRTMIGSGKAVGGWWDRTFLGFGTFQSSYWPDVGDVGLWLVPEAAAAHPLAVIRIMRETLQEWEELYYIRRWQAMVLAGWPEGQRLIELVGFTYEGTLRECEPGKDYAWYGRIMKHG